MNDNQKIQIERINKIIIEIQKIRIEYIKLLNFTTRAFDSKWKPTSLNLGFPKLKKRRGNKNEIHRD